ncbi:hypothetical protein COB72_09020 [bacterium]|nr:MAG: hypothetical protein COB72_09020 [bacterium]
MITTRLKNDNWALHQIAERQPTPGSLIKGTMPKADYLLVLAQQLLVNTALDAALQTHASNDLISPLFDQHQLLTPYIREDLAFFEVDTDSITPNPGTRRYIDHIAAHKDQPLHLLGLHYVRLGACNGNTFVARIVRKAFNLADNQGTRYLDPFGKAQRKQWVAFKSGIDALTLDQAQQDELFAGTRAAYVLSINLDLADYKNADALLAEHGKTLDKSAFDEHHSVHVTKEMQQELTSNDQ